MQQHLRAAFELAADFLDSEQRSPVREHRGPEELGRELDLGLRREGAAAGEVFASLRQLLAATPRIASRRFFNQLFGGRDAVATAAELMTVLANTPMHTFKAAGAQVLVEQAVIAHMAQTVGFADGEGMFTAGGSMSNLAALVVARNAAIPEAREEGLGGDGRGGRITVYTSAEGHFSITRGMGIVGLGRRNVRTVAIDARGRMDASELRRMLATDAASGARPMLINATAGTTVLGAFDPLREIAAVAREHRVWLHVDAAYGGSVLLSPRHRALLDGCELADSFSWDAHKAMGVPLNCSLLLLRRRGQLETHFGESADYLFQSHREFNPAQRSMQCARRNDALKLWAAWRHHGDEGYARRIDKLFALARYAAERIAADPDLRLCRRPESFNVCFVVTGCSSVELCERLEREERLVLSHVQVAGERALRLVCVNADLTEADIDTFFRQVKLVADAVRAPAAALAGSG